MILSYKATLVDSNKSIKTILQDNLLVSNRLLATLKRNNLIYLNHIPTKINCPIMPDDIIKVDIDIDQYRIKQNKADDLQKYPIQIQPEKMPIDIIYEDEYLIILNKKPGIVVHPTYLHPRGTMVNGLLYYFKENNTNILVRPVSRLDKGTSGVIVFAKDPYCQEMLIKQMQTGNFKKMYIGLVEGIVMEDYGIIDKPIARNYESLIERCVASNGQRAVTHFKVLKRYSDRTLLSFKLETGRTHQIRVHCKYIKHPLIGDTLYNEKQAKLIKRQALHSLSIEFEHPITKQALKVIAPVPKDIKTCF